MSNSQNNSNTTSLSSFHPDYTSRIKIGRTIYRVASVEHSKGYNYISLETGKKKVKRASLRHTCPERKGYYNYWFITEKQRYGSWLKYYVWLSEDYQEPKKERYISEAAKCAKAIREELKKHFPSHKFCVISNNFSMGDSVEVSWIDGPSKKAVAEITDKYQYGHFNGMEDMYEYSNSRNDIPQSKFVICTHRYSEEKKLEAKKEILNTYNLPDGITLENFNNTMIYGQWGSQFLYSYMIEQDEKKIEEKNKESMKKMSIITDDKNLYNINSILAEIEYKVKA